MAESAPLPLRLEMGYTPDEFSRTLTRGFSAPGSIAVTATDSGRWRIDIPEQDLTIAIVTAVAPQRRLGAISLPVLDVEITFSPDNEENRQAFLDRFWRYFHKGGG